MAAMLLFAVNFLVGQRAVEEVPAWSLTFWRTSIGALFVLAIVRWRGERIALYYWKHRLRTFVLSVTGVIVPALFVYLAVKTGTLIDLSVGMTILPLSTLLLSALLLAERLHGTQYSAFAIGFVGAMIFVFHGDVSRLRSFDPQVEFLLVLAAVFSRSLYEVLLNKWDLKPAVDGGGFVLLLVGTILLFPGFLVSEFLAEQPLDYSPAAWGSIAYVGIGMGALFFFLLNFAVGHIGASRTSLFRFTAPVLVAILSLLFLDVSLRVYQGIGAVLVVSSALLASRQVYRPAP